MYTVDIYPTVPYIC